MKKERLSSVNDWKVAICEDKNSEKVIAFANQGWGMSDRWWNETYKADHNGELYGVHKTPSGLRRTIK